MQKRAAILLFGMILLNAALHAHPPSAIKLSLDPNTHLLQVTVMHDTQKPKEHFIKTIQIQINGKDAVKQVFSSQTDAQKRAATYLLEDVKAGDQISASGECNMYGKKTEILKF